MTDKDIINLMSFEYNLGFEIGIGKFPKFSIVNKKRKQLISKIEKRLKK